MKTATTLKVIFYATGKRMIPVFRGPFLGLMKSIPNKPIPKLAKKDASINRKK